MKLVSIIIPTYNHAHFLERALKSVIQQTFKNWEILLIDNHSTDNTIEIVNQINDNRIRYFLIHNHGVIAVSRNFGISLANGDWIAFLDSDDYWYPDKLEFIVNSINNDDSYDVLCTNELRVDLNSGKSRLLKYGPFTKDFYKSMLLFGNRLSTSATVVRHLFLKKHNLFFNESKNFITVEDYDLWLNLARFEANFLFLSEIKGEYVIHSNNSSNQIKIHENNCYQLLREHVYNVQKFENNPDLLWLKINTRFKISELKKSFSERNFLNVCKIGFYLFILYPRNTLSYFSQKFNFCNKIDILLIMVLNYFLIK
jgi:glycosyltransferase involved in cell wall biosynthesis